KKKSHAFLGRRGLRIERASREFLHANGGKPAEPAESSKIIAELPGVKPIPRMQRKLRSNRSFPASNRSPGCRESCARTAAEEICRRPTNSREATMKIPLAVGLRTAEEFSS